MAEKSDYPGLFGLDIYFDSMSLVGEKEIFANANSQGNTLSFKRSCFHWKNFVTSKDDLQGWMGFPTAPVLKDKALGLCWAPVHIELCSPLF